MTPVPKVPGTYTRDLGHAVRDECHDRIRVRSRPDSGRHLGLQPDEAVKVISG